MSLRNLHEQNAEGFTLIEMLVTIIVISILSAIALPSFLNQVNKAKQSEAKQYIGALNRSQQAYFLSKGFFSSDMNALGIGIPEETNNYTYSIAIPNDSSESQIVINVASPKTPDSLKAVLGGVGVHNLEANSDKESHTESILCQSKKPQTAEPSGVIFTEDNQPFCAPDYANLAN